MIRISKLGITFNKDTPIEKKVLRNLNLKIAEGEFVTVIGSNGAGKTTLLNALSGEIKPEKGTIDIDGNNVTHWPSNRRAKYIARVFQNPLLGTCENLTIEENLALAFQRGQRRKLTPALKNKRLDIFKSELSHLNLKLEARLKDIVGQLSGGQRQALSLLMTTLQPMKILLLDEHTAALDPKTAIFVMKLTEKLIKEEKLTTLMVTHSMKLALEHGTRTIMLDEGKIVLDISGEERKKMTVKRLLECFSKKHHKEISDDNLLLDG